MQNLDLKKKQQKDMNIKEELFGRGPVGGGQERMIGMINDQNTLYIIYMYRNVIMK
jgi:hypothetical protein